MIKRYRRKPKPAADEQTAVMYEPLMNLAEALTVARMADSIAEVTEVAFPSGKRVLLAKCLGDLGEPRYVEVEPGDYLVYSGSSHFLYDSDEAGFRQFYDEVTDP